MTKITFGYDKLIDDVVAQRRETGLSVRKLGELWDIRPATIVEWHTRSRRPGLENCLVLTDWLGREINHYVTRIPT